MGKRYDSVSSLIKDLSKNEKVKESAIREIKRTALAKFLFFLRCEHKLTQKEIAKKIGCSQSRISKIESSCDRDITIQDLLDYGKALDLQLELGYRNKNVKIADLVKYHMFRIKDYLSKLADMAKGDEAIAKGVIKFVESAMGVFNEAVMENMLKLDFAKKKTVRESKEAIHISTPIQDKKGLIESGTKK